MPNAPAEKETGTQPQQGLLSKALAALDPKARHALLLAHIRDKAARVLRIEPQQIDRQMQFSSLGLDSVGAVDLLSELESDLGITLAMERIPPAITLEGFTSQILGLIVNPSDRDGSNREIANETQLENQYPLSQGQRALWFVQQLVPDTAAHNIIGATRVRSSVDVPALQRAFQKLLERHPVLRSTFTTSAGEPVQIVHADARFSFRVEDAKDWSQARLDARLEEEIFRSFDLENGPLFRVLLIRRGPRDHLLILSMHHLITDLWSMAIIMSETPKLYHSEVTGEGLKLKAPRSTYAEYVRRQAEMLAGPQGERLWGFWKAKLTGPLPVLNLPADRPRSSNLTDHGSAQFLHFSPQLTAGLRTLARQHHTSLFKVVLTAYEVLLHRYTGQDDIIIGSPRANRDRHVARVVGYFINPVVLRTNLSGDPSFADLLTHVSREVDQAFEHGAFPFPLLVERLQPTRDLSRSPIFQVMFSWQKTTRIVDKDKMASFALGEDGQGMEMGGLLLEPVNLPHRVVPFDLTLLIAESGDGMVATIEYNTALFDAPRVIRMLGHLQTILEQVVEHPDERLSQIPLLTPTEQTRILSEWAGEESGDQPAPAVVDQFEMQVERSPEATALVLDGSSLTYRQLNARANQLAHYLRALGLQKGQRVGLFLERSIDSIVSLLAILKAGGVYLPLDPAYPAERLAYMLADGENSPHGKVALVISQEALASRLPENSPQVIVIDRQRESIGQCGDHNPALALEENSPAYVIYTSGSTGKPKGVLIPHGAIANHCRDMVRLYHLSPADHVLQFASLNFDASLEQIFPTLISGARLVLRGPSIWTPQEFLDQLVEHRLTVINLPPAYWHQMAAAWANLPPSEAYQDLRLVIIGGDVIHPESVDLWSQTPFSNARLLNAYGPTETTITALIYPFSEDFEEKLGLERIPIGRPLANRKVYILDHYGNPVPAGVRGELHIGGAGLSLGYLGLPELSGERFVPDPFADQPGAKMYKTGDLAAFRSDGNIEFFGRVDDQVKVRGFRVELGEIASVLGDHPAVKDAAVVARARADGDKQLVAYIVPQGDALLKQDVLVRYLRERLPNYMLPAAIVPLDELPLTPGGKLDRRALPAPADLRPDMEGAFVAPRTPVEAELCRMWGEVLGIDKVGIYDDFFDLGGHSLMATQLIARTRAMFHVEIPLRRVFETPTIAALAQVITENLVELEEETELDAMLAELEDLSDDEVERLLAHDES